jgi:hypothetical protein
VELVWHFPAVARGHVQALFCFRIGVGCARPVLSITGEELYDGVSAVAVHGRVLVRPQGSTLIGEGLHQPFLLWTWLRPRGCFVSCVGTGAVSCQFQFHGRRSVLSVLRIHFSNYH